MSLSDLIKQHSSTSLEEASAAPESNSLRSVEPAPKPASTSDTEVSSSEELTDGVVGEESSAAAETSPPPESKGEEPWGVTETVTPSGIEIYYQAGPKRLYRLGRHQVPSVSEILDILEKGGLPWWGMKVGIEGVMTLSEKVSLYGKTLDEIVAMLTEQKLTVNHVRDKAGDRGTSVHDALELWATTGILPEPSVYAPEEQGYVSALRDFLVDSGAQPIESEFMVGSLKHKYAGRPDLRAWLPGEGDVVTKTYPKRKPVRATLPSGDYLLDLKTSKYVYETHFLQLEAYENAAIESGYPPTGDRGVIHVTEDGRYELVLSRATFTDFKAILGAYRALERIKGRK